jgi:hypothetical protein
LLIFASDNALAGVIGGPYYEILRFVLLSNRVDLALLSHSLPLQAGAQSSLQLLCVNAEPEPEREFKFQQRIRTAEHQ